MTQPLNYTPKAIEALLSHPCERAPLSAIGNRYIAAKLREAQVFVLADHGMLLDRGKVRPELPGEALRPPFPIVALEYSSATLNWNAGPYTQSPSSKRIALAWEWTDDLPRELRSWAPPHLPPGVAVASVCYHDEAASWIVIPTGAHIAYDDPTAPAAAVASPYRDAMIAEGRISKAQAEAPGVATMPFAINPEIVVAVAKEAGSVAAASDMLAADLMDEMGAYLDLCTALACANVKTREHPAPKNLNRNRLKAGKLPLKGFHVLELSGGGTMPGTGSGAGNRAAARSHLRRGHIRRLPGERVTWVNSTVVRGRGFLDKVYAA